MPGKRRINLKLVQFVGFETGDSSTLKVPKELRRTYLVVLPLCVFSHGSYDGLAISISFKPKRMHTHAVRASQSGSNKCKRMALDHC
jgi:hypothetical protein